MAISTGAALLGGSLLGTAGSLLGGRSAARGAERGAETAAQSQREALDYLKEVEKLPLQFRDEALPLLAGAFGIGEGSQQDIIDDVTASPFYQAGLDRAEQGFLRNQAATGGLRSGASIRGVADINQSFLQDAVNQRLGGLSQFAFPNLNTNAIAQGTANVGNILGQGQINAANARQAGYGGALSSILGGINTGIREGVI